MTHSELRDRWALRREVLSECGDEKTAKMIEKFLADLDVLAHSEDETILTLAQAVAFSGYSVDHLGFLVRQGKIPNVGRKGIPRIRLGDLPHRTVRNIARTRRKTYDVDADARTLRIPR
ncbi:MAG TPA: hypothetical protein VNU46_07680 [Gemmatimonadaceae bacterium]|jgi:hypothetical protein|nr:hypothetical protein [Gemmatimonadaceae bacterium]